MYTYYMQGSFREIFFRVYKVREMDASLCFPNFDLIATVRVSLWMRLKPLG